MKYRTTQPFIAFGKVCEPGDVVELTEEQAVILSDMESVAPYETKVMPKPENKSVGKSLGSSRPARPQQKPTRKSSSKRVQK